MEEDRDENQMAASEEEKKSYQKSNVRNSLPFYK